MLRTIGLQQPLAARVKGGCDIECVLQEVILDDQAVL